jgi:hypothetical protein
LLFDRRADPNEQDDLAGQPGTCAQALAGLRQVLSRKLASGQQARADLEGLASGASRPVP